MLKWIILLILIVGGVWVYFNVDFNQVSNNAENAVRNEKTIKKFFEADAQNKEETQQTIKEKRPYFNGLFSIPSYPKI